MFSKELHFFLITSLELGSTITIIFILQINQEELMWFAQGHCGDQSLLLTPNILFSFLWSNNISNIHLSTWLPRIKSVFPSLPYSLGNHVTKFWLARCKQNAVGNIQGREGKGVCPAPASLHSATGNAAGTAMVPFLTVGMRPLPIW